MLDRTLEAATGLDVTVLYATTVAPFDADGLAREAADAEPVIAVAPFLEGTLAPAVTAALSHRSARYTWMGVPPTVLRDYGTPVDHDRAHGLDAAGIRARLVAALG
jgi:transketolase